VSRLVRYWPLKATCTPLGIAIFFAAYFWIMHHPMFPVTVMPLTAVDRMIPFDPRSLPVYFSLWAYVSIAPALLRTRRELWVFALATAVLSVIGLCFFIFLPTAVPPAHIDWTLYPSIEFLKDTDLALNACPSMHVAFSVFTMMWIGRVLNEMRAPAVFRWLNGLWCAAILYSTIATRQHVALDVLAGAVLGAVVAALHLRAVKPGGPD
jgi:membrane-associated phospholipid phosphatase